MKTIRILTALALAGFAVAPALAASNVALGATVVTSGTGFGNPASWGGYVGINEPANIVSGSPLADGNVWNQHVAYWSGPLADNWITINLAKSAVISSFSLQADNNDTYSVSYWNGSSWTALSNVGTYGSWGLATRPDDVLAVPVTTKAFRIAASGGDGYYSVGQFSAFGNVAAVPEPETYAMMLLGLGLMAGVARRRKMAGA